jgi:hypothetical protein
MFGFAHIDRNAYDQQLKQIQDARRLTLFLAEYVANRDLMYTWVWAGQPIELKFLILIFNKIGLPSHLSVEVYKFLKLPDRFRIMPSTVVRRSVRYIYRSHLQELVHIQEAKEGLPYKDKKKEKNVKNTPIINFTRGGGNQVKNKTPASNYLHHRRLQEGTRRSSKIYN